MLLVGPVGGPVRGRRPGGGRLRPGGAGREENVDAVKSLVVDPASRRPTERIYRLKRGVVEFRRAVERLAAASSQLAARGVTRVGPDGGIVLRLHRGFTRDDWL